MWIGSKVLVINGIWYGKKGVVKAVTEDGNLLVMLVDDIGELGQWILRPFDLELEVDEGDFYVGI